MCIRDRSLYCVKQNKIHTKKRDENLFHHVSYSATIYALPSLVHVLNGIFIKAALAFTDSGVFTAPDQYNILPIISPGDFPFALSSRMVIPPCLLDKRIPYLSTSRGKCPYKGI